MNWTHLPQLLHISLFLLTSQAKKVCLCTCDSLTQVQGGQYVFSEALRGTCYLVLSPGCLCRTGHPVLSSHHDTSSIESRFEACCTLRLATPFIITFDRPLRVASLEVASLNLPSVCGTPCRSTTLQSLFLCTHWWWGE